MELVCPHCAALNRVPEARLHDQPKCGKCGAAVIPAAPINLSHTSFDRFVGRDGLPVLGVVFAPVAPDGDGDLLAWAEGAGPLRRNGVPVARAPLPATLGPADVVIVSQAGDRAAEPNAAAVAPARFRALPSIAWQAWAICSCM